MLSVPHVLAAPPSGITLNSNGCLLNYDGAASFAISVPELIAPFLSKAPTVLLVTFRRTNIVSERDVFVNREDAATGE